MLIKWIGPVCLTEDAKIPALWEGTHRYLVQTDFLQSQM